MESKLTLHETSDVGDSKTSSMFLSDQGCVFIILVMVEGDVQTASGRRAGCSWKTYSLITVRDVSVDFLFTLCTFLPLYTRRERWKCVSVLSDR
jgi:hypothetical protein